MRRRPAFASASARLRALALAPLLLLAACAPPPDTSRPGFAFAAGWLGPRPGGGLRAAPLIAGDAEWWRAFRDPALDGLVALALADSPTLAAARARAAAAAAAAGAIPGAVTLSGGAALRGSDAAASPARASASADLGLDVLFDPGRGRAAERAAAAAAAALARAEAAGARLFLTGEVTGAYIELRLAQRREGLARAEAARRRQTLALAETLAEAGAATRVDALRSRGRLAEIAADLPGLAAAVASGQARLAVLAGRSPGALPPDLAAALSAARPQPRAALAPDPGIPADILRNRPDLAVAEAAYDAARAALGQARAQLYPRLSLSGVIEGSRGIAGADRGGAPGTLTLGPALRLPALPAGPTRAAVAAREAGVIAAHADWTAAVLAALLEVETALLDHRAAALAEGAADRSVALYAEAVTLTRDLAARGEATLGDLIDAEAELARAEATRAEARAARARGFVALNIRLGAGGGADPPG